MKTSVEEVLPNQLPLGQTAISKSVGLRKGIGRDLKVNKEGVTKQLKLLKTTKSPNKLKASSKNNAGPMKKTKGPIKDEEWEELFRYPLSSLKNKL